MRVGCEWSKVRSRNEYICVHSSSSKLLTHIRSPITHAGPTSYIDCCRSARLHLTRFEPSVHHVTKATAMLLPSYMSCMYCALSLYITTICIDLRLHVADHATFHVLAALGDGQVWSVASVSGGFVSAIAFLHTLSFLLSSVSLSTTTA